jgi:hypothetical protein
MGKDKLDRGLPGHLRNGYFSQFVKEKYVSNQGNDLDARAKAN